MKNTSRRDSVCLSNPVDPSVIRVLRLLDPIACSAECAYFVAGATARDLVLVNVYGLRPGRATRDIDFGIAVESWAQFELVKEHLIASRAFAPAPKAQQRLIYSDPAAGFTIPVDLIPFRGIAAADGTIGWPPSRDIVMNVSGFEEALKSSVAIEVEAGLTVRVASVPGLTLLKLTAWADRGLETNKDAADLYRLLTAYADAGNENRLYDQEPDLLNSAGFDMELAGAELLGRDVAKICEVQASNRIRSLMLSDRHRERLSIDMLQFSPYPERTPTAEEIVKVFCRGFMNA
jgi:predicted nucleotidyltransferase